MLVIAGMIRIDPSQRDEAIRAAVDVARESRKEAGCIGYVLSADLEDPGTFRLFEEWESQEALERHFYTPHMGTFQERMARVGVKEMAIQKYHVASVGPIA